MKNPRFVKSRGFFVERAQLLFFYPYYSNHQADEAGGEVGVGDAGPDSDGQGNKGKK